MVLRCLKVFLKKVFEKAFILPISSYAHNKDNTMARVTDMLCGCITYAGNPESNRSHEVELSWHETGNIQPIACY